MSGSWWSAQRRPVLVGARGVALTLVFAGALTAGAATGSWDGGPLHRSGAGAELRPDAALGAADRAEDAAASAHRGRGQLADDAEELVSRSGDRWATAYTAREYEGVQQALDGTYIGVGLSVAREHGRESAAGSRVAGVKRGSPAAEAGVREGDRLLTVDGSAVRGVPVTDVVALLRGSGGEGRAAAAPGSEVGVLLERDGRRWRAALERTRLSTRTVTVDRLDDGTARVRVAAFTRGAGEEVREAVAAQPAGAGVLLDLRGNSGGLVEEAVDAAGAFLDGGLVATYDAGDGQRALYAEHGGDGRRPVAVLVDGGTMSAGELLAGALQDRGRAVIVGGRTFGKGAVQIPRQLPDGSVAELTVGHYTTPGGHRVEGTGIVPDLPVEAGAVERARRVLGGLGTGA
ncbi:S41 family peptidase [Streptomyces xiaopingdaonensis]|uniref:S41 family peptidase n=1 Tax=Streptomyces xiaopingdaonensis TaxID=1565415 RepID=UPI000494233B|nr:S41 family peptidase [Streptomyces xiaopingdaonensis]